MHIDSVSCIYFSPTGTTKAIAQNIAQGMAVPCIDMADLCQGNPCRNTGSEPHLTMIAVPVHHGRVPEMAADLLAKLRGENQPAVVVVVYSGQNFGDALLELHDICHSRGFIPVAAGAFVAAHAYSSLSAPIAHGRPDMVDREKAQAFGFKIRAKLMVLPEPAMARPLSLPGRTPYRKQVHIRTFVPESDPALCRRCGRCAQACPPGAIVFDLAPGTDRARCIQCLACVRQCPYKARQVTDPGFLQTAGAMAAAGQERREPRTFL